MTSTRKPAWFWPLLIIAVTIGLFMLMKALGPTPPEAQRSERSWSVQAIAAQSGTHSSQLRLLGRVESAYETTLTASISADVQRLDAREGQRVNAGDVLLHLDPREAQWQLAQRQAEVAELKAQQREELARQASERQSLAHEQTLVELAERAVRREEQLKQSNLNSEARLDQARQSLQSARLALNARQLSVENQSARREAISARLARAEALLAQASLDLERTQVRAPFQGILTRVAVSPGERVRPGEALITLYATEQLEVRAQIPQRWVNVAREALAQGQPMQATLNTAATPITLQLARLSGQVNASTGGIDALFTAQGAAPGALSQSVELRLELPPLDGVYQLPVSALYGTDRIYAVRDGRLHALTVEVAGERFDGANQFLLIRSADLQAGEPVITTQLPNAIQGLKVDVRTAPDTTTAGARAQDDPA